MGQAAEHDMRQRLQLPVQRGVDVWMVVAMDGAPPGGHAIDQFPAVGESEAYPLCRNDREDRQVRAHGAVGMPDQLVIQFQQLLGALHDCRKTWRGGYELCCGVFPVTGNCRNYRMLPIFCRSCTWLPAFSSASQVILSLANKTMIVDPIRNLPISSPRCSSGASS